MKLITTLPFLVVLGTSVLAASLPFKVNLPEGFSGPETAASGPAQSFAYTRPSAEPDVRTLFQVTIATIPPEGKDDSLDKLLAGMLRGVERRRTAFKKTEFSKTLLSSLEARAVEWEGIGVGHQMKGRMICAVSEGRLICIHYQDSILSWDKSRADLGKALESFRLSNTTNAAPSAPANGASPSR